MSKKSNKTEKITSTTERNEEISAPLLNDIRNENQSKIDDKKFEELEEKMEESHAVVPDKKDKDVANEVEKQKKLPIPADKVGFDSPPPESPNKIAHETSDAFTGKHNKNTTLEMKLSALIEQACGSSSDLQLEDSLLSEQKSSPANLKSDLTDENLLSVLEDDNEKETTTKQSTTNSFETLPVKSKPEFKSEAPRRTKKYVYRLKSKSGKMLRYSSFVPIVLKKPLIKLTKMDIEISNGHDVSNSTSTKETLVKKKAVNTRASNQIASKRKGRTSLAKKWPPAVTLDDQNSLDPSDNKDTVRADLYSSFGMQTRKRKLKFLPDGRLIGAGKRHKSSSLEENMSDDDDDDDDVIMDNPPKESSDEDWQATGDELKELNFSEIKKSPPEERKTVEKKSKPRNVGMLNGPSYQTIKASSIPRKNGVEVQKSSSAYNNNNNNNVINKNNSCLISKSAAPKHFIKTNVDPAQVLSSLLGVTILPSQLNMVRFRPKFVHNRQITTVQQKVHLANDTSKKVACRTGSFATSTPLQSTMSRPSMQRILPKTVITVDNTSLINKTLETKTTPSNISFSTVSWKRDSIPMTSINSKCVIDPTAIIPNFDHFTDSRTVRTKGGPKKSFRQKLETDDGNGESNHLTVYNLAQNVFDRMPSWNLHIIPDTNTFCIAQVSRGRMGIPILRKSIELNNEFAAKIYVHQLHCKKYDGVYDTESKILSLIGEIDALAA